MITHIIIIFACFGLGCLVGILHAKDKRAKEVAEELRDLYRSQGWWL